VSKMEAESSRITVEVKKLTGVKIKTEEEVNEVKVILILISLLFSRFLLSFLRSYVIERFQSRKRSSSTETTSTASKRSKQIVVTLDDEVR
jgi:hypothetical protein